MGCGSLFGLCQGGKTKTNFSEQLGWILKCYSVVQVYKTHGMYLHVYYFENKLMRGMLSKNKKDENFL